MCLCKKTTEYLTIFLQYYGNSLLLYSTVFALKYPKGSVGGSMPHLFSNI